MESTWHPGHIVPVVRVKITKDKNIPQVEQIDKLGYIPMGRQGDKYDYFLKLISTSKRIIPKKLVYVGNTLDVSIPSDEYVIGRCPDFWNMSWNRVDEEFVDILEWVKSKGIEF